MALTFKDVEDVETYKVEDVESLETDTDIVSNEPTGYFAWIEDCRVEISKKVYEALKKHTDI